MSLRPDEVEANASLIVTAVNAYDAHRELIGKLVGALGRICKDANRQDLHGNGANTDLVPPYLINEARDQLSAARELGFGGDA